LQVAQEEPVLDTARPVAVVERPSTVLHREPVVPVVRG
jgi:hypothetical protein